MHRLLASIAAAALAAACTPQASEPEAVVIAIYKPLADSKGAEGTRLAEIPMTTDLRALVGQAEEAFGSETPVFDFDVAGNCQDCTGFSDLKVSLVADDATATETRKNVEANFRLPVDGERTVYWDMVKGPQGWQADNIIAEGFNLRSIAGAIIASSAPGPEAEQGVQCMTYLRLHSDALKKITPPADTTAADKAFDAYRKDAEIAYSAEELAQFLATNIAVFDDTPPEQIAAEAEACIAQAPPAQ
jgi:hypothetical protein